MTDAPEILAELRALRADLARVASTVERLAAAHAGRSLSQRDALAASLLWPLIGEHFAGRAFVARELIDFAAVPLSTRAALRAALLDAIGGALDKGAARRFGKFARRMAGAEVGGGWRLDRLDGADRLGVLWALRVCEPSKVADNRACA
jgi:hypothetical protein